LLSIGSFDVTDIIDNTAGGVVGLGILALLSRTPRAATVLVMTRAGVIFTVVALVAVTAYLASPIRYQDRQDVIVHRIAPTRDP
jgi:glycopeptide antibiotics resistance protein